MKLWQKGVIAIFVAQLLSVLILLLVGAKIFESAVAEASRAKLDSTVAMLAKAVESPLLAFDLAGLDEMAQGAQGLAQVSAMRVLDADGQALASSAGWSAAANPLTATRAIAIAGVRYGAIEVAFTENWLAATKRQIGSAVAAVALILILASGALAAALGWTISRHTAALTDGARRLRDGDFGFRFAENRRDEFGETARVMNAMAARIQGATETLERKVEERTAALAQNEAQLRAVIENAPLAISIKGRSGRFLRVNEAFASVFDRTVAEIEGRAAKEVLPEEVAERMDRHDAVSLTHGRPHQLEAAVETGAGERVFLVTRFPVFDEDGDLVALASIAADISERKAMESALSEAKSVAEQRLDALEAAKDQLVESEKLASLGGLVAGVAHEINTPIGVAVTASSHFTESAERISGAYEADTLSQDDFEAFLSETRQTADIILRNLDRASGLIQSFKMIAVDQSSSEIRDADLHDYIDNILFSFAPKLRAAQVSASNIAPRDITISADLGALGQVIGNLLSNSMLHAFADRDGGEITISAEQDGDMVTLSYSDNGCGMPDDVVAKIFDPFFTTKRGNGGSGLGMHIVYNIVTQSLGGSIKCHSTFGRGTSFHIRFSARTPAIDKPALTPDQCRLEQAG